MSNIDFVKCYYPLPDEMAQQCLFETESLHKINMTFEVSKEGQLFLPRYDLDNNLYKKDKVNWTGRADLKGIYHYGGCYYFSYYFDFNKGKVYSIKEANYC